MRALRYNDRRRRLLLLPGDTGGSREAKAPQVRHNHQKTKKMCASTGLCWRLHFDRMASRYCLEAACLGMSGTQHTRLCGLEVFPLYSSNPLSSEFRLPREAVKDHFIAAIGAVATESRAEPRHGYSASSARL